MHLLKYCTLLQYFYFLPPHCRGKLALFLLYNYLITVVSGYFDKGHKQRLFVLEAESLKHLILYIVFSKVITCFFKVKSSDK